MTTLEQLSAAATELLPCPLVPIGWCKGGKITTYEGDSRFPAYVRCESCRTTKMGATQSKAIAAWNTRTGQLVEVQADDATVERLSQVLCEKGSDGGDWNKEPEGMRMQYRADVRAILAAMKGPKL